MAGPIGGLDPGGTWRSPRPRASTGSPGTGRRGPEMARPLLHSGIGWPSLFGDWSTGYNCCLVAIGCEVAETDRHGCVCIGFVLIEAGPGEAGRLHESFEGAMKTFLAEVLIRASEPAWEGCRGPVNSFPPQWFGDDQDVSFVDGKSLKVAGIPDVVISASTGQDQVSACLGVPANCSDDSLLTAGQEVVSACKPFD